MLLIGSNECSGFELRPMEIGKVLDVEDDDCVGSRKRVKCGEDAGVFRKDCPFVDEKRKARKKGRRPLVEEKKYDRTVCSRRDD